MGGLACSLDEAGGTAKEAAPRCGYDGIEAVSALSGRRAGARAWYPAVRKSPNPSAMVVVTPSPSRPSPSSAPAGSTPATYRPSPATSARACSSRARSYPRSSRRRASRTSWCRTWAAWAPWPCWIRLGPTGRRPSRGRRTSASRTSPMRSARPWDRPVEPREREVMEEDATSPIVEWQSFVGAADLTVDTVLSLAQQYGSRFATLEAHLLGEQEKRVSKQETRSFACSKGGGPWLPILSHL